MYWLTLDFKDGVGTISVTQNPNPQAGSRLHGSRDDLTDLKNCLLAKVNKSGNKYTLDLPEPTKAEKGFAKQSKPFKKSSRKPWSDEDIYKLVSLYSKYSVADLAREIFPHRTEKSIRNKAYQLRKLGYKI